MKSNRKLYWLSQFIGWLSYVVLMGLLNQISGGVFNKYVIYNLLITLFLGILTSHLYRALILRLGWAYLKITHLIARVIIASFSFGLLFIFLHTLLYDWGIHKGKIEFEWVDTLLMTLNLMVLFILWSLLYFLYHFFVNYRKEEIKNLKQQALQNELELNNLKSQLNPHFIFNAMNTIRALISENPESAKSSVTRLANILRNSLLMGRKRVIKFSDELGLVEDYLNLEKSRFEERLTIRYEIEKSTLEHLVPPMLVQTLAENGIKHGISKLQEGGVLKISTKMLAEKLNVEITNSGQLTQKGNVKEKGFGISNTLERLKILYGDKASFTLENKNNHEVIAKLIIPSEESFANKI